jgi:hypothetical protein
VDIEFSLRQSFQTGSEIHPVLWIVGTLPLMLTWLCEKLQIVINLLSKLRVHGALPPLTTEASRCGAILSRENVLLLESHKL